MAHSIKLKRLNVTVSAANEATIFISESTPTSTFTVFAHTGNAGNIYVGDKEVGSENIPKDQGSISSYSASSGGDFNTGDYFDLSNWYVCADNDNDKIIVEYYATEKV